MARRAAVQAAFSDGAEAIVFTPFELIEPGHPRAGGRIQGEGGAGTIASDATTGRQSS